MVIPSNVFSLQRFSYLKSNGRRIDLNKKKHPISEEFPRIEIHNAKQNSTHRQLTITKQTGKIKVFLNQAKFTSVYLDTDAKFPRPRKLERATSFQIWIRMLNFHASEICRTNSFQNSSSFQNSPLLQNFSASLKKWTPPAMIESSLPKIRALIVRFFPKKLLIKLS